MERLAAAVIYQAERELRVAYRDVTRPVAEEAVRALLDGVASWNDFKAIDAAYPRWREARAFFARGTADSTLALYAPLAGRDPDVVREKVAGYMNLPWNGRAIQAALVAFGESKRGVVEEMRASRARHESWAVIGKRLGMDKGSARKMFRANA